MILSISATILNAQSYQRMAIPRGVYNLSPNSAKAVSAYCVDFTRDAPTNGIAYNNLLEGSATVVYEGINQTKTLAEAIKAGDISIEGTYWQSSSAFLRSMDRIKREQFEELLNTRLTQFLDIIRNTPEYLQLPSIEKSILENRIAREFTLYSFLEKNPELWQNTGNWSQLKLINHTNSNISIQAEINLQLGTNSETIASIGLQDFDFRSSEYNKAEIQEKAWIQQTKNVYNRLKRIGEYQGDIPSDKIILSEAKSMIQNFQEKYGLESTGKLENLDEKKIVEIENNLMEEFRLLNESPDKIENLGTVIENYQTKNNLAVTGNMNSETFQQISNQKESISLKLRSTIHNIDDKNLSESIDTYKQIKKLKNKETIIDNEFITSLNTDSKYYIFIDGDYKSFEKSDINITNADGIETKKLKTIRYDSEANVHLILDDKIDLKIEILNKKLDWNYDIDEITILPLTKNKDTRDLLEKEFGKNWIKTNLKTEKEVAKKLKKCKRKTVLTVGHIENGYFVEGDFRISIDALNKYAKEFNLNIFHLGCSTAVIGEVGTASSINTYKTVEALITTIKENNNFKNFFLKFSTKGIDPNGHAVNLLIDENTISNKDFIQFKLIQKASIAGTATITGSILLYYLLSDDDDEKK